MGPICFFPVAYRIPFQVTPCGRVTLSIQARCNIMEKGKAAVDVLKKMKILLVDDDESIRISMEYFFRHKTAEFRVVESAELGMKTLVEGEPVDIVIVDYKLPGMDGLSFLEIVKKQWPNVLTVMITAHGNHELALNAKKMGVDHFIQKPFSTRVILEGLKCA
jgi:DNA-binding NtrC family response regulator